MYLFGNRRIKNLSRRQSTALAAAITATIGQVIAVGNSSFDELGDRYDSFSARMDIIRHVEDIREVFDIWKSIVYDIDHPWVLWRLMWHG